MYRDIKSSKLLTDGRTCHLKGNGPPHLDHGLQNEDTTTLANQRLKMTASESSFVNAKRNLSGKPKRFSHEHRTG